MATTRFQNVTPLPGFGDGPSSESSPKAEVTVTLPAPLVRPVLEAAERWATRVLSRTRQERRCIRGGWPGTVTEARALLTEDLLPRLTDEIREVLERVGRDHVVSFLYQGARGYWIRREAGNATKKC